MLVVMQPDRLHSVIENLLGHAAEVVEGLFVTAEKQRQGLAVGEVEVLRSGPTQGHHETLHPLAPGFLEGAPIDLSLTPQVESRREPLPSPWPGRETDA